MRLYDALKDGLQAIASPLVPVIEFGLALTDDSMPDPDLMLTSEPDGPRAVPLPSVALVIEVAATTLADDLGVKQRLYARFDIPEYWVADLENRVVHQMWLPKGEGYAKTRQIAFGSSLAAATVDNLTIDTAAL